MNDAEKHWRYLVRGLQGLVMMFEEHERERIPCDPTTRQNFNHFLDRLNVITLGDRPVPIGEFPEQAGRRANKRRRRSVDGP